MNFSVGAKVITSRGGGSKVRALARKRLQKRAEAIRDEMRAMVAPHSVTNRELKIQVHKIDPYAYAVGANDRGLYFLNNGSNPVRGKFMSFRPYKGYWDNIDPKTGYVYFYNRAGFNGIHFVEEVARRHRNVR